MGEEGRLLARTFAMQSSPASARGGQSLRGGWATQNPATTLNQIQGVPGTGFPSHGESARKPVAGPGSQSYDSHRGQPGGKVAWDTPTYSSRCKFHSALSMQVCKTGDLKNACRALKGFGLVTCRQVPAWHTASSLGPESCRSKSSQRRV